MSLETNVLYHEDCLNTLANMEDESIDLTFTCPPYLNATEYPSFTSYDDYLEFMGKVVKELHRVTKEGRFFVLNTSSVLEPRQSRNSQSRHYPVPFDLNYIITHECEWDFIDSIVWEKPETAVGRRIVNFVKTRIPLSYKPNIATEYLMVYRKRTHRLVDWNIKKNEYAKESKVEGEIDTSNVWKIDVEKCDWHPNVFPKEMADKVISYYSFKNDVVYDPFMGSGTTALSALDLGRKFIGSEIDNNYYAKSKLEIDAKLNQEKLF